MVKRQGVMNQAGSRMSLKYPKVLWLELQTPLCVLFDKRFLGLTLRVLSQVAFLSLKGIGSQTWGRHDNGDFLQWRYLEIIYINKIHFRIETVETHDLGIHLFWKTPMQPPYRIRTSSTKDVLTVLVLLSNGTWERTITRNGHII
jgi:hypothetical protein